jgi:hypothetical protein
MRSMAERDGCARSGQFRYAGANGSDRLEAPAPIALTFESPIRLSGQFQLNELSLPADIASPSSIPLGKLRAYKAHRELRLLPLLLAGGIAALRCAG